MSDAAEACVPQDEDDDDVLFVPWYELWTGNVTRGPGRNREERDLAVILFRDGRDDSLPPLARPRIVYDDEWRVNRLLSVLAYAEACWDLNRLHLLASGGGHGKLDDATFRKLWLEIAGESESLIDRIVFIRRPKGEPAGMLV